MADIESPILNPDAPNTRNVYTKHFAYLGPMRPSPPDSLYVYTCACGRGAVSATGKYGAAVSTIHWGAADASSRGERGAAGIVDGVTIMPNTWYECHRGKLYKVIGGPNDQ